MSKKYTAIISVGAALLICLCISAVLSLKRGDEPAAAVDREAKEPFCMLVLGEDRVSGSTDVMMLVSFNREDGRICVMQIPRDTYADYGNRSHKKINSARELLGGERELCEFLGRALAIKIDGYLSMDLDGFGAAVDAVGGVEMELDRTLYYDDPAQGLHIYLQKGRQLLDGEKAEMLVRYRSGYVRGDLGRLDVQKEFMKALFLKLKDTVSITNAYDIASKIFPYVETNVSLGVAVSLGCEALKVEPEDITFVTLLGREATGNSGASFYVMDAKASESVIEEYFTDEDITIDPEGLFRHPDNREFQEIYDGKNQIG